MTVRPQEGRLFAVVGPSGAGKDTLIAGALAAKPGLSVVRRVITRPSSAGGEDFEGTSSEGFAARLEAGDFALHWHAHGLRYAIPRAGLAGLAQGADVLFNGSRLGLPEAAAAWPGLIVLHITAPPEVLSQRLAARGRETAPDIARRVARAALPLPDGLDVITIVNDDTPQIGITRFLAALQPRNNHAAAPFSLSAKDCRHD